MNLRTAHLSSIDVSHLRWRPIEATGLEAPQLDAGTIAREWRALEAAATAWARYPAARRIERIATAAAALRREGPGDAAPLLARSAGLSPAGLAAAWDITFAACDEASLASAVAAEPQALDGTAGRVVHILAGNVLPPTWTMLVRGFLVGAPQWLRPSAREPLFAATLGARLRACAPELASLFAVTWWPHADAEVEPAVLAGATVVTVQGADASVEAIEARVRALVPTASLVGFGTRWSASVVSRGAQSDTNVAATARAVARDVALFDGQGCLSSAVVWAEDGPDLVRFAATLAHALAAEEARMPRGGDGDAHSNAALRAWRESIHLGCGLGSHRRLWESEGDLAWAVALQAQCRDFDRPLDRHVAVVPFTRLDDVRAGFATALDRLQGLGVAWDEWTARTRDAWCAALRPTRVAIAGTLQEAPPGWRQDHRAPLESLLGPALRRR